MALNIRQATCVLYEAGLYGVKKEQVFVLEEEMSCGIIPVGADLARPGTTTSEPFTHAGKTR